MFLKVPHLLIELRSAGYIEVCGKNLGGIYGRLDEFFTKFCTPLRKSTLGTECDQGLKDHLLKIVVTISADGGPSERRALFLACGPGL